jgi:hypothetical protein
VASLERATVDMVARSSQIGLFVGRLRGPAPRVGGLLGGGHARTFR